MLKGKMTLHLEITDIDIEQHLVIQLTQNLIIIAQPLKLQIFVLKSDYSIS